MAYNTTLCKTIETALKHIKTDLCCIFMLDLCIVKDYTQTLLFRCGLVGFPPNFDNHSDFLKLKSERTKIYPWGVKKVKTYYFP